MLPVAVPQHLDAAIAAVTHDKVALIIKRNTACTFELPIAAAIAANAAHVRAIAQPKHLNAPILVAVVNSNIAVGVDGNATRKLELPCAAALAAYGTNVSPVPVP